MSECRLKSSNGNNKVRVHLNGKYDDELLASTNGWSHSGIVINEKIAEMAIDLLSKYLSLKNNQE